MNVQLLNIKYRTESLNAKVSKLRKLITKVM